MHVVKTTEKHCNSNFKEIYLYLSSTQSYTDQLLDTDAEECGDLYLDVAENYMHVRLHRFSVGSIPQVKEL